MANSMRVSGREGFRNPLITSADLPDGGVTSAKLATSLQSDNYVAGSAGWKITRSTGDAEFNDVTVRGTIEIGKDGNVIGDSEGIALPGYARLGIPELELRSASIRFYDMDTPDLDDYRGRITGYDYGEHVEIVGGHTVTIKTSGLAGTTAGSITLFNAQLGLSFDGSGSAPAITWAADSDTGIFHSTNLIGLTAGGSTKLQVRSADTRIDGINDTTTAAAANVFINSTSGLMARSTSSRRYKRNLRSWDHRASVLDLAPTLFRSKAKADDPDLDRLGLIAEDVADRFPLAVLRDDKGRPDAIDWSVITAGILAELIRLDSRVQRVESATLAA